MLLKCGWVTEVMEGYAPPELALEYDNVGLLLGSKDGSLNKLLIALDLDDAVADEAVALGADMVLTHHPIIFKAIKRITDEDSLGRRIIKLLRHNITVYAAHTNLDMAEGGTNDVLAALLGLENLAPLDAERREPGRIGALPRGNTLGGLADLVKERLELPAVGVTGDMSRPVRRVGLCTGAGSGPGLIAVAKARGCDVYITGDVTYHNAQAAAELDIALIDATHYGSEVIIVKTLKNLLEERAAEAGAELKVLESKTGSRMITYI